jgi:succinate dehydrogenase / fumarate reductase flavoprotein subunit
MSESLRGEGARVWVPSDGAAGRPAAGKPWYFLEDWYPAYGNLVPRDIATRAIFKVCRELGLGVDKQDQVYLDLTHLPAAEITRKLGGVVEIYEKFVGDDPRKVPMRVFPAVHYSMGGLWVDAQQMTNIAGLFAVGEAEFAYHGANRLGANSLLSCLYGGLVAGPAAIRYATGDADARSPVPTSLLDQWRGKLEQEYATLGRMDGPENPYRIAAELGDLMTGNCTVIRHNDKLRATDVKLQELIERWYKCSVLDTSSHSNRSVMYLRQVWNMLVLARVIAQGALLRDESRGAHYKPDFPQRNDAQFLKTTMASYPEDSRAAGPGGKGVETDPTITYREVDTAHIAPRERTYDVDKGATQAKTAA